MTNMANVANMMMLKHGTRVSLFWIPTCRLAGDAVQALNRDPRLTSELDFSKTRLNNLDMTAHFSHYTEMSIITFKGISPTFLLKVTISGACKSPKSWMKKNSFKFHLWQLKPFVAPHFARWAASSLNLV